MAFDDLALPSDEITLVLVAKSVRFRENDLVPRTGTTVPVGIVPVTQELRLAEVTDELKLVAAVLNDDRVSTALDDSVDDDLRKDAVVATVVCVLMDEVIVAEAAEIGVFVPCLKPTHVLTRVVRPVFLYKSMP